MLSSAHYEVMPLLLDKGMSSGSVSAFEIGLHGTSQKAWPVALVGYLLHIVYLQF